MDGEGDGADGDDDDDDDPDDARWDEGDGGDDSPVRERISLAESPRQEGVSSLCRFRRKEAVENF